MSIDRDAILEHHLGLTQRQRVALVGRAMIGRQEAQLLVEALHCERLQRAVSIELLLFLQEPSGNACVHVWVLWHETSCLPGVEFLDEKTFVLIYYTVEK